MSAIHFKCSGCDAALGMPNDALVGKKIICPKCGKPTLIRPLSGEADKRNEPAVQPVCHAAEELPVASSKKPQPVPEHEEAVVEQEKRPTRTAKKKGKKSRGKPARGLSLPLVLGLAGGGIVVGVVVCVVVIFVVSGGGNAANQPATKYKLTSAYEKIVPPAGDGFYHFEGMSFPDGGKEMIGALTKYDKIGTKVVSRTMFRVRFDSAPSKEEPLTTLPQENVSRSFLSPNGTVAILADDPGKKRFTIYNLTTGEKSGHFEVESTDGYEIDFAPGGTDFLTRHSMYHGQNKSVWDFQLRDQTGKVKTSFSIKESDDLHLRGHYLSHDASVLVLHKEDKQGKDSLIVHNNAAHTKTEVAFDLGALQSVRLTPDGKSILVSYAEQRRATTAKHGLFSLEQKKMIQEFPAQGSEEHSLVKHVSGDGKVAVFEGYKTVYFKNGLTGQSLGTVAVPQVGTFQEGREDSVLSPDGRYFVLRYQSSSLYIWKLDPK